MQTTTILSLLAAALLLALLGLAAWAQHTATRARAAGYNHGLDDATSHYQEVSALNAAEVCSLHNKLAAQRVITQRELEATMQDCDARIAAFARRTLTLDDLTTLRILNTQLLVASQTYSSLGLADQVRHANTASARLEAMVQRLAEALPDVTPAPLPLPVPESSATLTAAANVEPNGKSWLVHGPEGCGKTANAPAIAQALGLSVIIDDWHHGMPVPRTKALVLTNDTGPFDPFTRRVLTYAEAMSLVASKQEAAA